MSHSQTAVAVVAVVVAVLLIYFFMKWSKKKKLEAIRKILAECFGEPVYAGSFSLREARDWIKARKELIDNGYKAVVCKLNKRTFKMFGKDFDIDFGPDKYLVAAVVADTEKDIREALLVRYERLDAQLEDVLAQGDGVFVVEN